jgi:hypothetical protein
MRQRRAILGLAAAAAAAACVSQRQIQVFVSHSSRNGCTFYHEDRRITLSEVAELARAGPRPARVVISAITNVPDGCYSIPAGRLRSQGVPVSVMRYEFPRTQPRP